MGAKKGRYSCIIAMESATFVAQDSLPLGGWPSAVSLSLSSLPPPCRQTLLLAFREATSERQLCPLHQLPIEAWPARLPDKCMPFPSSIPHPLLLWLSIL